MSFPQKIWTFFEFSKNSLGSGTAKGGWTTRTSAQGLIAARDSIRLFVRSCAHRIRSDPGQRSSAKRLHHSCRRVTISTAGDARSRMHWMSQ